MTKSEIRKVHKSLRKDLTEAEIEDFSLEIANQLLGLPIWNYQYYHLFLSIIEQKEVNTDYILNILAGKDKHVILSKSNFSTLEMSHFLLTDATTLKKNKWHIPEPVDGISISTEKIEVVFIPLLAFDNNGNRIGYGKGFYDTFLKTCKAKTIKIGLSFFEATEKISDVFKHDIKLDYCITPKRIYSFV